MSYLPQIASWNYKFEYTIVTVFWTIDKWLFHNQLLRTALREYRCNDGDKNDSPLSLPARAESNRIATKGGIMIRQKASQVQFQSSIIIRISNSTGYNA